MQPDPRSRFGAILLAALPCIASIFASAPVRAQREAEEPTASEPSSGVEHQESDRSTETRTPKFSWHYKRVHRAEGIAAGALAFGAIAVIPIDPKRRWVGDNTFDAWFGGRLLAPKSARHKYATASDVLAGVSIGVPILVDLVGVVLIGDRNRDVGLQMFAIQAQAFALSGFVTNLVKLSGRARPCAVDGDCASDADANESFFSGHASLAFTGAGLTCAQHVHLRLFGRAGDATTCAGILATATVASVFRVVSNKHWMTDVLTGAGVGLISGWLMPWLMHYRHDMSERASSKRRHLYSIAPFGGSGSVGLSAAGSF
jgi:membrane-associated phospholipid phosphatase